MQSEWGKKVPSSDKAGELPDDLSSDEAAEIRKTREDPDRCDVEAENLPEEGWTEGHEDVETPAVGEVAHHQSQHGRTLQHVSEDWGSVLSQIVKNQPNTEYIQFLKNNNTLGDDKDSLLKTKCVICTLNNQFTYIKRGMMGTSSWFSTESS